MAKKSRGVEKTGSIDPCLGHFLGQMGSGLLSVVLLATLSLTVGTGYAHAYLDPGSGSMILQILLGVLFGSLFMIKVFWRRLTGALSRFSARIRGQKTPSE